MKVEGVIGINFLFKYENLYLAGQPTAEITSFLKENNVKSVINLRSHGEVDDLAFRESVAGAEIEYIQIPIMGTGGLDKAACGEVSKLLNDNDTFFIHCGTANRVGGWLITDLVSRKGQDFDQAVEIALQNGLTNPALIQMAKSLV